MLYSPLLNVYKDETGLYRLKSNDQIPFDEMLKSLGVSGVLLERHQGRRTIENHQYISELKKTRETEIELGVSQVNLTASIRGMYHGLQREA